ncbi:MAG: hypothetical protein ACKVIQ_00975 [Acidimicrobiales bacterium]
MASHHKGEGDRDRCGVRLLPLHPIMSPDHDRWVQWSAASCCSARAARDRYIWPSWGFGNSLALLDGLTTQSGDITV